MSVNMAAPSPIISELGDTTQCFKRSVVIETCSLWLECSMSMAGFTLSNGFTIYPTLDVVGVIPMEEVITICSPFLGAWSNAPLPCLASNKVS